MVEGVTNGYTLTIEIVGVGYRVAEKGKDLEFQLGYSHNIQFPAPEGITFKVESPTKFHISGIDKQLVGEVAAKVKKLRKADPYKGKGLRLSGEVVRRKERQVRSNGYWCKGPQRFGNKRPCPSCFPRSQEGRWNSNTSTFSRFSLISSLVRTSY
jgi:hypothetical protein